MYAKTLSLVPQVRAQIIIIDFMHTVERTKKNKKIFLRHYKNFETTQCSDDNGG